jgi:ATP-dependent helicase HepA
MVRGALDLLLGSESGNSAFGVWKTPGSEAIFLEIYAVIECVAPAALHVDRFLPAVPVRVLIDHALTDHTADESLAAAKLEKGDIFRLLDRGAMKKKLLPAMLKKAREIVEERMKQIIASATVTMSGQLRQEAERLEALRAVNDHVRPEEIAAIREQESALRSAIASAHSRLDALRLIFRIPG